MVAPKHRRASSVVCVQGTMYGPPMTWGRCNRCSFSFFDHLECLQLPTLHQELFPCIRRQLGIFDSCVWAPQLSWWLHFYRPEDLFLTTTAALADPDKRMQVRALPRRPPAPRREMVVARMCIPSSICSGRPVHRFLGSDSVPAVPASRGLQRPASPVRRSRVQYEQP